MPLYEYACTECRHRFEVLQRMNDGSEGVTCPECGAGAPQRQLSTFSGTVAGRPSTATAPSNCGPGAFT